MRVDGYYWDDKYAGRLESNRPFGIHEEAVGACHFSVSVMAVVEDHPLHFALQKDQLPCRHYKGISCICDNFQTKTAYDMC